MPDDDVESGDLDLESHEEDEISTYDLPGRDPCLSADDDRAPSSGQGLASEDGDAIDSRSATSKRTGGSDDAEDVETRHASTADSGPDTGERVSGGSRLGSAHVRAANPVTSPALPIFTLTLTFRMKNGLGLCCEPRVQALVGQRNAPGALPPAVPPLARVLTLAGREEVENANFSLLGAQVGDLLAAYALKREEAAQAEAQKKKAQAAGTRQRKRDEEARRLLASSRSAAVGGTADGSTAGPANATGTAAPVGADPRAESQLVPQTSADRLAADTTQLSLFG